MNAGTLALCFLAALHLALAVNNVSVTISLRKPGGSSKGKSTLKEILKRRNLNLAPGSRPRKIIFKNASTTSTTTTSSTTTVAPEIVENSPELGSASGSSESVEFVTDRSNNVVGTTTTAAPSTPSPIKKSERKRKKDKKNGQMLMIPVPSGQRRPYTPLIIQSTTASSTPVAYKLNKLFTPIGIYGRVNDWKKVDVKPKGESREQREFEGLLTRDYHRVSAENISLTTEKPNERRVSIQHERVDYGLMPPPPPLKGHSKEGGILSKVKSAAGSITGMLHEGLSSLSGITATFDDPMSPASHPFGPETNKPNYHHSLRDQHFQGSSHHSQHHSPPPRTGDEGLEYFRKRPHLFASPSGFKPVTVSPSFAREYYGTMRYEDYPEQSREKKQHSTQGKKKSSEESLNASYLQQIISRLKALESSEKRRLDVGVIDEATTEKPSTTTKRPEGRSMYGTHFSKEASPLFGGRDIKEDLVVGESSPFFSVAAPPPTFSPNEMSWDDLTKKYSLNELTTARDRLFTLFSGPSTPTYEQMMIMKPPSRSGHAFDDLVKLFKFSFKNNNAGSKSGEEWKNYSGNSGVKDEETSASGIDTWKPLGHSQQKPYMTFKAGLTFHHPSSTAASSPALSHESSPSHFSSSSKPFRPDKYKSPALVKPTSAYSANSYNSVKSFPEKSLASSNIEIIPSSEYYKIKDTHDIAAIIKPKGMSEAELRSQIPNGLNVQIINESGIRNHDILTRLNSLSSSGSNQYQGTTSQSHQYFNSQPQQLQPVQQLQQQQQFAQQSQFVQQGAAHQQALFIPQQQQQQQQQQIFHVPQVAQQYLPYQHIPLTQQLFAQPQQQQQQQAGNPYGGSNVDPDILSIIQKELEKDDVPEEFRKDFAPDPNEQKSQKAQPKSDNLGTVFHAPIPIKKEAKLPKYIEDLAKKLRTDKNVQGIVRVSRIVGGVPKEFLYPVRG